MSGEVVNLRLVRKAKRRAVGDATATVKRARFGRAASDRASQAIEEERARRLLDGARLGEAHDPNRGR